MVTLWLTLVALSLSTNVTRVCQHLMKSDMHWIVYCYSVHNNDMTVTNKILPGLADSRSDLWLIFHANPCSGHEMCHFLVPHYEMAKFDKNMLSFKNRYEVKNGMTYIHSFGRFSQIVADFSTWLILTNFDSPAKVSWSIARISWGHKFWAFLQLHMIEAWYQFYLQ